MDDARPLICPVIVGRDDLLVLADRRIRQVADGRGHLLLIAGEAGLGKTRLLGAIERRAAKAGFHAIHAGTYPSDLQVSAAIFIDLARALLRDPELQPFGRRLADRLDATAATDPEAGDPGRRRRLLVLEVAEILVGLAADRPLVLSLEDLHWSDDLTLEILEAVARRVDDVRLLAIGTYRSDELYPRAPMREWRARLVAGRRAEEIRLRRLTRDETATMTALLRASPLPPSNDVAEAIHARTDGIPLHVEELLALLGAGMPSAGTVREADVPATVEAAIWTRLMRRSPAAMHIAEVGAVIGRAFDVDLLSAVAGQPPDALSAPLGELADHFILVPARTPGGYAFRHALIGDAIYAGVPEPRRRALHGLTADAAANRIDVVTHAFLALHYERAGRPAAAFRAALDGAEAATRLSSHTEARDLYACTIRTAPADLDPAARARIIEGYARSLAATDDNDAAADAYERARVAWLEAGDSLAAAAIAGPLVAVRHLLGDPLDARASRLRDALGEITAPPALHGTPIDPAADRVRARLQSALAAAYMLDRRLDEGIGYAVDARRLAAIVGDHSTERQAATTHGACLVFAGQMDEGWRLLEASIHEAIDARDEAGAARAYRMIGSSASVLVEYGRGETQLRAGIEYAERVERWNDRHYMAAHLAHVLWATGRWDDAEVVARRALADGRGGITTRLTALHVLGYVALGRDRLDEAAADLDEAYGLATGMRELQRISPALWGLAEIALARGKPALAAEHAEAGVAASEAVSDAAYLFPFVVTGVRAHLDAGDPLEARRWLERCALLVNRRSIPGTLTALDHGGGLLDLAEGATGRARTALSAAAEAWDARDRAWEGTWARVDLARAQLRSNRRNEAAAEAAAALDRATGLAAPALEAAANAIMGAARRGAPPEPWAPLTAREFEIARLVADGRTNGEIGEELGIARKTVAAHVEHILAKLGVNRRTEIAAWTATRLAAQRQPAVLHSRPHGDDREE